MGSIDETREFDPPVTDPAGARLDRTRFGGHLTRLLQFLSTGD